LITPSKSQLSSLGQLTHTRRTDGAPEPDGALKTVARAKIRHYRQLYINHPDPIAFMPEGEEKNKKEFCGRKKLSPPNYLFMLSPPWTPNQICSPLSFSQLDLSLSKLNKKSVPTGNRDTEVLIKRITALLSTRKSDEVRNAPTESKTEIRRDTFSTISYERIEKEDPVFSLRFLYSSRHPPLRSRRVSQTLTPGTSPGSWTWISLLTVVRETTSTPFVSQSRS
jgi:hypothetical protein